MKHRCFFPGLPVLFLLILSACSCSTEEGIQQILGAKTEAPVFLDCRPVSSTEVIFKFSLPVRVVSLNFNPSQEAGPATEGREVRVSFKRPLEEGQKITADILVEDAGKNSLNVIVPFRARNDRMPALVFNELRPVYTAKPRGEFVEFLALEPGNLGALRLFIAGHSLSAPFYEFPPSEVKAGEYIVLHLRTFDENCADETGADLALSGGAEAQNDARDFWIPGSKKRLDKTDALWLLDQDDKIIDAVLLSENPGPEWGDKDTAAAGAAAYFGKKGAWLSSAAHNAGAETPLVPDAAVITGGSSPTRTVCRDESLPPGRGAGNWYITANSSATPGKLNSPKRYR